ncbi:HAMP domain-containing protein [Geoalkalibacter ferrihydriticus]|uniref:Cytochrome C n=2 Tax=Geoalkalibacter ferrihydriticus TaxID=392333 RepID=A0A0C2HMR8_9BACT|nr:HAMP domain-containing protein [Geoalkalibacter ferrihydriticus]KIH76225.1 cytochrome C [Geoalkalibacter ferrihydriticus DSM 17813]SDL26298.1 HAMP domain-containing protein [Geoalkalibacter ferrihydriticus]
MSTLKTIVSRALVPVGLTVTGFVIVCSILLYSFVKQDLIQDTIQREIQLADIIVKATRYSMLKDDRESLRQTINDIGGQKGVEHVRIFNKRGVIMFSAHEEEVLQMLDKEVAGCIECHAGEVPAVHLGPMDQAREFKNEQGKPVIAITAAVYNEPSCYTGACHVHSPDEQILGTLDIGMSQAPLLQSLATLRIRLIIFCLMVMVLTVGGVIALLRRNVLLPVRQLVYFADRISDGDLKAQEPEGTEEVASLAANFKRLAQDRHQCDVKLEELQKRIDDLTREIKARENASKSL